MTTLIYSFRSEWLKTKRSAASWLTICGALLVPIILLIARLRDVEQLYQASRSPHLWEFLFSRCWQVCNVMLLPLGVILVVSLVAQVEFRNNAWKQLLTTPQSLTAVFFVKLLVILAMLLQFFVLFNLGIYLCGVLPSLIFRAVPYPLADIPFTDFMRSSLKFFIAVLPIVALQYLVSIRFKNFLLPLGMGIGLYVASMVALSWKYVYFIPYCFSMLGSLRSQSSIDPSMNLHAWAAGYFVLITLLSYLLFITNKEKG